MNFLRKKSSFITTDPVDRKKLESSGENIYSIVAILGKRADQINSLLGKQKKEEMESFGINLSPNPKEVREGDLDDIRISISKSFEKIKPTSIAVEEFLEGVIQYRKLGEK